MIDLFAEAKYKKVRDNLRTANASQDPELLRQAIKDFKAYKVPEKNGDLTKAKRLLEFLMISQGKRDIYVCNGCS